MCVHGIYVFIQCVVDKCPDANVHADCVAELGCLPSIVQSNILYMYMYVSCVGNDGSKEESKEESDEEKEKREEIEKVSS